MHTLFRRLLLIAPALFAAACASAGSPMELSSLENQVAVVQTQIQQNPDLQTQMDHSYGCAIFPSTSKLAAGIDVGYGRGIVYEHHRQIGQATMLQYGIGAALGGQNYWQVILFPERSDLDDFRAGPTLAAGNATGIFGHSGEGTTFIVPSGCLSVVQPATGLMFEVSIAGQTIWFQSLKKGQWNYTAASSPLLASR
jgi:lipid-binding SYLF domain-containing protein